MTDMEQRILRHFRNYLVAPGIMLCFDHGLAKEFPHQFKQAIASLTRDGLIQAERRRGAFSLTDLGFQAAAELPALVLTRARS